MKKLFTLIALLSLLNAGAVLAGFNATVTLPETRTDNSAFDPRTELGQIPIGCGDVAEGPFTTFAHIESAPFDIYEETDIVDGVASQKLKTQFGVETPENKDYYCVAYAVDTGGRVSAPSPVVAKYTYVAPPMWIQLLEMEDQIHTGVVNFNFTIVNGQIIPGTE